MSTTTTDGPLATEPPPPIDQTGSELDDPLVRVMYPSIWLIFLGFPVTMLVASDLTLALKALGLLGLAVFAAIYAASWWKPRPFRDLGARATTALWVAALAMCQLALLPVLGGGVASTVPFTAAVLVFRLPRPQALMGLGALAVVVFGGLALTAPQHLGWAIPVVVISVVILLSIRLVIDREDRTRTVSEQLRLSRQREAIGRDVHDLLGHSLTVITLKTELARRLLEKDPQRAAAELDEVLSLSRRASAEVRLAVGQLHVPDWPAQLASARTALDAAGIVAELPAPDAVPAAQQPLMAWCLRESVTNAVRHSGAGRFAVEARPGLLEIEDDGVGLPADLGDGSGLRGLRERVEQAGGRLELGPARIGDGADRPGTRLQVTLPRQRS